MNFQKVKNNYILTTVIGPEVAKELTDQLFAWIQTNAIDVRAEMGSSRILGAALKQATADPIVTQKRNRDEDMHDIQEPKKALKITDRLGPSISERLGKNDNVEHIKTDQDSTISRQKCSFWPNCKR